MDDIDWVKVKQKAGKEGDNKEKDDGSVSSDSEPEQIDELQSWRGLPIWSVKYKLRNPASMPMYYCIHMLLLLNHMLILFH